MNRDKILYWVFTGLISAWMLLQGFMFTFSSHMVAELFLGLGMPTVLIIPLGVAKLLAVIAIVSGLSRLLKQLAYLGLAVDFFVALGSHIMSADGQWLAPVVALLLLIGSFIYSRRLLGE